MNIKGSKTEKNLLKSFAGESQARNRYTYFAKQAKKDGYVQISEIFEETANQEMQHAKTMFKYLEGGDLEITATYPAGKICSTLENLKASANGENEEWTELYPEFAKIAKEEGFDEIAQIYKSISIAEKQHEDRYRALIKNIEDSKVFSKENNTTWRCRKCGYIHEGKSAVEKCPACAHPQAYFEELLGPVSL
jgi:rubrerythrin